MVTLLLKLLLNQSIALKSIQRERSTFSNLVLSALTQVARFTSCFLIVRTHHQATLLCQWHLPFSVQSDQHAPTLVSSTSYLESTPFSSSHFKIQCSSQNIIIIPSQNMPIPLYSTRLANPSKVSFKPSKIISSWQGWEV